MKLALVYEIDQGIREKFDSIREITDRIKQNAEQRKTLIGLEYIGIKLIIRRLPHGYEAFVKPQKPKFRRHITLTNPLYGDSSYEGYLSFDLLFSDDSYEQLASSSDKSQIKQVLRFELLRAETVFKGVEKKLGKVDINEFRELINSVLA